MSSPESASETLPRFNLRKRLTWVLLLVGLVPLLVASGVANLIGHGNLRDAAVSKLVALRDARAQHIQDTYATIEAQVLDLASSCTVKDGLAQMGPALRALPEDLGWTSESGAAQAESLRRFYRRIFLDRYESATGRTLDAASLVPTTAPAIAAQLQYLVENPNPPSERPRLDRPDGDDTAYGRAHAEHHPVLRGFLERFGYHDVFLVDAEGVVVYSVMKEVDLATDLLSGPYRASGLARAASRALDAGGDARGGAVLTDYDAYLPSLDAPAAFIAAPVVIGERVLGAVVFQMPIDRINAVMTHEAGMGETGETYLVGSDLLMRSDSRFQETSSILNRKVDTEATRAAFRNETDSGLVDGYRGTPALSAWMPLHLLGLDYALVAEIDQAEAFEPADRLFRWLLGLTVVLALVALAVSRFVASSLSRPVGRITRRLEGLAQHLLSESQEQQAGAAEQSAAVEETRQTFQGLLDATSNMNQIGQDVLGHAEVGQRSAQTIGGRIEELSTSATAIAEILDLVKEIANRSEILALNAALEGTKAGEAGRGFSLVAQQMQRLAEQVMESVKRIENLTHEISQTSRGAVLAAEEAEKVSHLTTEAARGIAGAVSIQQSSAEQISVAMDEISQVATRNVGAARQVVASSNDLLRLAEHLRETVGVRERA